VANEKNEILDNRFLIKEIIKGEAETQPELVEDLFGCEGFSPIMVLISSWIW
jgi:hypothetical protein